MLNAFDFKLQKNGFYKKIYCHNLEDSRV